MKKDFLTQLFGSSGRVKMLRLFLGNEAESFEIEGVMKRAQVSEKVAKAELKMLEDVQLVKRSTRTKKISTKKAGKDSKKKGESVKRQIPSWKLNVSHPHLAALRVFLRSVAPLGSDDVVDKLKGVGRVRLVATAGMLIDDPTGRVDMLVVGDNLDERKLQTAIRSLEAECGQELRYASFRSDDFKYRLNVYDKLVRDIFDYPHEILLDRFDMSGYLRN